MNKKSDDSVSVMISQLLINCISLFLAHLLRGTICPCFLKTTHGHGQWGMTVGVGVRGRGEQWGKGRTTVTVQQFKNKIKSTNI